MPHYAVMNNNIVTNLIVADSKEDAELLTGTECIQFNVNDLLQVGYIYDGEKFSAPE